MSTTLIFISAILIYGIPIFITCYLYDYNYKRKCDKINLKNDKLRIIDDLNYLFNKYK